MILVVSCLVCTILYTVREKFERYVKVILDISKCKNKTHIGVVRINWSDLNGIYQFENV
jgi:hypothetical protein